MMSLGLGPESWERVDGDRWYCASLAGEEESLGPTS
jgi:hypothetical protein